MRLLRAEIVGLLGKSDPIKISFNEDLNITTGKNGAGKTTLIKLLWYVISGNVGTAIAEVQFQRVSITTDKYRVNITKVSDDTCKGDFTESGKTVSIEDFYDDESEELSDAREKFNRILAPHGRSLFFPTFRRIEGGFTIGSSERFSSPSLFNAPRARSELQDAVLSISRRLSELEHTFVTSISTFDVAELLLRRYTEMSEEASSLQRQMSQDVIERIKDFKNESYTARSDDTMDSAVGVIDNIRSMIENNDRIRDSIMAPLKAVQGVVAQLLEHSGIQIGRRINFGDAANAINSESLSAGEKQMLSFICYNAFSEDSIIFIDEPELSLHIDWQRMLFPTLLRQKKNNQFIIATHSPFIYSKYPDKEIMLSPSRGDSAENLAS
ncbi:AAA family ATPase [Sphingomonas japonica]|uniref:ATP-binding protein involved in virulence n=1 Tax=Sphingomonas japonica TaxID=511662 RepID=A0ABX0U3W8_9SPHN|nr:AAA family ATPase [Sphingomonas japonica]NIJ24351.1 putative ATP-binding protein involved in virulence [Sphingomonas japonica]